MTGLKPKEFIPVFYMVFLVMLGALPNALGDSSLDLSSNALNGVYRVGIPTPLSPQINLSGTAGYGLTESMDPVEGLHHRFLGRLALGAHLNSWLALALLLDGRFDRHPEDEEGVDTGGVAAPHLVLRAGGALGELFHLGGEIRLWVPGIDAPSMEWEATTVDFQLLSALSPSDRAWSVALLTGFRLDRSAHAAPALDRLRPGDRIALGLSDSHSVLLGLAGTYRWSRTQLLAELSWDLLVGDGASTPLQSPIRANLGLRQAVIDGLCLELLGEVALSQRPQVGVDDPLVPIEPRFTVSLGLRYVFDLQSKKEADSEPISLPKQPSSSVGAEGPVVVSGMIVDPSGVPVTNAVVSLTSRDGAESLATTNDEGRFVFDVAPPGQAELSANAPGFIQGTWAIEIGEKLSELGQRVLEPLEEEPPGSQIRGMVQSFKGEKIPANVVVEPIGIELRCGEDGMFQVDVPPGTYELSVSAPGYATQKRKVVVEENGVSILNIDLRRRR